MTQPAGDPLSVRIAVALFGAALRFDRNPTTRRLRPQMRETFRDLCRRERARGSALSLLALAFAETLDAAVAGQRSTVREHVRGRAAKTAAALLQGRGGRPRTEAPDAGGEPRHENPAFLPAGEPTGNLEDGQGRPRATTGRKRTELFNDVRAAMRVLHRRPGFAAAVLATLTIGVGSATTIFAVVDNTLIRPLPFPHAERLVELWSWELAGSNGMPGLSAELRRAWETSEIFDTIEVFDGAEATLVRGNEPEQINVTEVTDGMLDLLGARAMLGRRLIAADAAADAEPVVVLSEGLWRRRFGADPNVLGAGVRLDDTTYTVIGIMPRSFAFPTNDTDLWAPLADDAAGYPIGRLAEGLSIEAAQQRADELAPGFSTAGLAPEGWGVQLFALRDSYIFSVGERATRTLWILFGAVSLLLLIAAANVTSLMLSQLTTRRRELAVRAALGAGPAQLARQLFAEAALLGAGATLGGLLFAGAAVRLATTMAPRRLTFLVSHPIAVDGRVLAFAAAVVLCSMLLYAGLPVAWALRQRRTGWSWSHRGGGLRGAGRARGALVVAEVAIAAVLLVGAGLLVRSMAGLLDVDPGFATDVTTITVHPSPQRYRDPAAQRLLVRRLEEAAASLPGVTAAAVTNGAPPYLGSFSSANRARAEGQPPPRDVQTAETATDASQVEFLNVVNVSPNYFRVLDLPLLEGRAFEPADDDAPVAIISEDFARRFWHGESAVGGRLRLRPEADPVTIVGVVPDVLQTGFDDARGELEIYYPITQVRPGYPRLYLVLRGELEHGTLLATLRERLDSIDPQLPISSIASMEELLWGDLAEPRFNMLLLVGFATVAIVLAAVGIYGVLAFSVAQRTREIGVRMALGARRADMLRRVIGTGLAVAAVGLALGAAGAWGLTRFLRSLLFDVEPLDPATMAVSAVLLLLIALAACLAPALRATRVDPMVALRTD